MTEREKRLAGLLGAAAVLAACALIAASGMERLQETALSIDRYQSQLARIEARAAEDPAFLEARIGELSLSVAKLEERTTGNDREDFADFGAAVRRQFKAAGASVLRYQSVQTAIPREKAKTDDKEIRSSLLEFSVRGSPLALSQFLLAAANAGWKISFLSVRSEPGKFPVEFVLRISHGY